LSGVGATPGGTLTIASDIPVTVPPTPLGSQEIPLAGLGGWTRIQVTGLTTQPASGVGTVYLRNDGASPIEFHAWGVVLTQLGRDIAGVGASVIPLGFDPGPTIYSSLSSGSSREFLTLPPIGSSTAATGFCIGAEGQPASGMTWQGPFFDRRTLVEWSSADGTDRAKIMVMGTAGEHLLEMFFAGSASGLVKGPFSVPVDTAARIKGCVAPDGAMTLYVDDVPIVPSATQPLSAPPPDLLGGTLSVGSDHTGTEPWHGFVRAAVVCRLAGVPADCW